MALRQIQMLHERGEPVASELERRNQVEHSIRRRYPVGMITNQTPMLSMVRNVMVERMPLGACWIDPWSAHDVMMRSFGFLDCVALGDTGLTAGLKALFALDLRPGRTQTLELMRQFSPYRSLATFHLWHRLGVAA